MSGLSNQGFRLSPQQRHLWSLQRGGTDSLYRSQLSVLVEGDVDSAALRDAVLRVVERHEILRSSFVCPPGLRIPLQVVGEPEEIPWRIVDVSHLDAVKQEGAVRDVCDEELRRLMRLDRSPLLAPTLITLSSNAHLLLLTMPSLCADSCTLKNLFAEITDFYRAGRGDSDEPVQYADFAEWEHELIESADDDAVKARAYWRRVDDSLPLWSLPFAENLSHEPETELGVHSRTLDSGLLEELHAVASSRACSLEAALLTCWMIVLSRLGGETSIAVGTIFDGRRFEELRSSFGLFARCLPIVYDVESGRGFSEVLRRVQNASRASYEWQDYYTSESGDASRMHAGFEYAELPSPVISQGASFSLLGLRSWIYPFKLRMTCTKQDNQLIARFNYQDKCFRPESVARIAKYFEAIVRSSVQCPDDAAERLQLLDEGELRRLTIALNAHPRDRFDTACIHELIQRQVERTPERTAVTFKGRRLTYALLNSRANQLAHYLRKAGVGSEVRVGVCVDRSVELFIAILGVLKAGGVYVPLNPEHPENRLWQQLSSVEASLVLTQQHLMNRLTRFEGELVVLDCEHCVFDGESQTNPVIHSSPDNLCYVVCTSGSAGKPKAVAITHRNLVSYTTSILDQLHLKDVAGERQLNFATVSTIAADLGNTCIFPSLVSGGCLHVVGRDDAMDGHLFAQYVSENAIDVLKIVPSHLSALLGSESAAAMFPREYLILGGEALSASLVARISEIGPSCRVINHYGPTEATVGSLTYHHDKLARAETESTVPIGRPLANTRAYILDKHLQPVPIGVRGELYLGGAGVVRGYINQPEQTAASFLPDPFATELNQRLYKTGDAARFLSDGTIEFLGRMDNQIKLRGFRIEPAEIEGVLNAHPAVRQSAIKAWVNTNGDGRLAAYVAPSREVTEDALREWVRAELPDYMVPSHFVLLKSLPLTANGKLDRNALPSPEHACAEAKREFEAPRTHVEIALANIFADLLKVERVSIRDNFFELGGHSLLATQAVARIRKLLQIKLPLHAFFESPSVAGLASKIEPMQEEAIERVLAEVSQVSDQEAQRILQVERTRSAENENKAASGGL